MFSVAAATGRVLPDPAAAARVWKDLILQPLVPQGGTRIARNPMIQLTSLRATYSSSVSASGFTVATGTFAPTTPRRISANNSGLSFRNRLTFSRPWPRRTSP